MKQSKTPTKKLKIPFSGRFSTAWRFGAVALLFGVVGSVVLIRSFASSAYQLYLSPAVTSVQAGDTFTVSLRIDPGTTIDTVDSTITFDPNYLQYVSSDSSASPFTTSVQANPANGSVQFVRTVLSPGTVTTDSLIANVTFKALASTSNTGLQVNGNAAYQGTAINPTLGSANIAITDPAPPPPAVDTTSPVVNISSPRDGLSSRSGFTVSASATDDTQVARMEVDVDNSVVYSVQGSSLTYKWNVKSKRIAKGSHVITVKAFDTSNNVGTASVTVTKQ